MSGVITVSTAEGMAPRRAARLRIACLPGVLHTNPYHRLLYDALRSENVQLVEAVPFKAWPLLRRRRVDVLHLHWLESFYRARCGTRACRRSAELARVLLLGFRLGLARACGYRVLWTVHQVHPHERRDPLVEGVAARIVGFFAHALIAHDAATLASIRSGLGRRAARKTSIIPHGTYAGAYGSGHRDDTRAELDIGDDCHVFLSFGHVRAYKSLDTLLDAFARLRDERAVLMIAGMAHDPAIAWKLEAAATEDPRIRLLLRFIDDEEVADLFAASDVAVFARADGGTSGSVLLALAQGLPVLAVDTPTYREAVGDAGWLVESPTPAAFAEAMVSAIADRADAAQAAEARAGKAGSEWPVVAHATAALLRRRRRP